MICKCGEDMECIATWDDCNTWAYNLYACPDCGNICKENVWDNKGQTWITASSEVTFISEPEKNDE
jgi:hypothetical protein